MRASRIVGSLLVVGLSLLAGSPGVAQDTEGEQPASSASPTWQQFTRTVDELYLQPRRLSVAELTPRQLAKILGHAVGRQAHYVGDDAERRSRFEALQAAARQALETGLTYLGWLVGEDAAAAGNEELITAFEGAIRGFYDDEILELTGLGPEATIPSVLSLEPAVSAPSTALPRPPAAEGEATSLRRPCRFYVDPTLYTDAKPDFAWALVRRPWRDGFYYETWPVDPDWSSDHAKQPRNRLREGQEIVLIGSKSDVLRRIEQLRPGCG